MKIFIKQVMIFLGVLFLFNGCGCNNTSYSVAPSDFTGSGLQFNGMYQSEVMNDGGSQMWHYVHFYEDGTVITVWSPGTPAEIISWFNKENIEHGNFGHGKYEIEESQLSFTSTYSNGTVDYEGTFEEEELTLNSHSNINDAYDTRTYTFVELSEE